VFVRALSMAEGQRLQKITRTARDPVRLRRAIVVLMSAQGQPAPDIAHLLKATDDYVRDVIHAFNDRGFDALDPKWKGGTPNRPGLVPRQPRRAGLPADLQLLAELDRIRVRSPALLRAQRHRSPISSRARRGDRRQHPLAQPTRPTENRLRHQLQDSPPGLPLQGRMTRH
jgi:hypothetical protein